MTSFKKTLAAAAVAVLTLGALPALAAADNSFLGQIGKGAGYADTETVEGDRLPAMIGGIIKALLGFLGIIFLVLMVYAGYLWMTARGDSKSVDKAKDIIKQAIIGIVITMLAYAITGFVIGAIQNSTVEGDSGLVCTDGGSCSTNSECDSGATCLKPGGSPPGALGTCTCLAT